MIPSHFKRLESLPLTQNGKVDKKSLEKLNGVQLSLDSHYQEPRNDIEELLEGIWSNILQLNRVGIHDNFISLGGHSLAAIRITARINEELQLQFPLSKIFELPTIAEYASYIEDNLEALLDQS